MVVVPVGWEWGKTQYQKHMNSLKFMNATSPDLSNVESTDL